MPASKETLTAVHAKCFFLLFCKQAFEVQGTRGTTCPFTPRAANDSDDASVGAFTCLRIDGSVPTALRYAVAPCPVRCSCCDRCCLGYLPCVRSFGLLWSQSAYLSGSPQAEGHARIFYLPDFFLCPTFPPLLWGGNTRL